jgi:hypothetical protein
MKRPSPALPRSERDRFVLDVMRRADGHVAPVKDAVTALLTIADVERLVRHGAARPTCFFMSHACQERLAEVLSAPAGNATASPSPG